MKEETVSNKGHETAVEKTPKNNQIYPVLSTHLRYGINEREHM